MLVGRSSTRLGSNNIPLTISKKSNEQTTCARQTHRGDGSSLEPLYLGDAPSSHDTIAAPAS